MKKTWKIGIFATAPVVSTLTFGETIAQPRDRGMKVRIAFVGEIGSDSQRTQLLSTATESRFAATQQASADNPGLTRELRGRGVQLRNVIRHDRIWSGANIFYVR